MMRHVPIHPFTCAVIFALAALVTACDEKLSDLAGPTPNLAPTFSAIQRDVFEAKDASGRPACVTCHGNQRFLSGGLDLRHDVAYANLVGVRASGKTGAVRVVPGDADASYIVHKLAGASGIAGLRMPLNGPYLTDGQLLILKRWIANGAKND